MLPPPEQCNLCGSTVEFVCNAEIYGRAYGRWPYAWLCRACGAYVGTHPHTDRPLGLLADAATRTARKEAHAAFDPLWKEGALSRNQAYKWLAEQLGIAKERCHIGEFDVETCAQVVQLCEKSKECPSTEPS